PQHLPHNRDRLFVGFGVHDARIKFGMNRLPVQTAWVFLPVLVANGGPDFFKRLNLPLLFQRVRLPAKGGRDRARKKNSHFPDWMTPPACRMRYRFFSERI